MEKIHGFVMDKSEAQELLQNILDDSGLKLIKGSAEFYAAVSDTNFLDGGQVDERLAQALKIGKCIHYALGDDHIIVIPGNQNIDAGNSTPEGEEGHEDKSPCPYCEAGTDDFVTVNQTVTYSGIEVSLNRIGMLRARAFDKNGVLKLGYIAKIEYCPLCGRKFDRSKHGAAKLFPDMRD